MWHQTAVSSPTAGLSAFIAFTFHFPKYHNKCANKVFLVMLPLLIFLWHPLRLLVRHVSSWAEAIKKANEEVKLEKEDIFKSKINLMTFSSLDLYLLCLCGWGGGAVKLFNFVLKIYLYAVFTFVCPSLA